MSKLEIVADAVEVAAVEEADKIAALKEELLTVEQKVDPSDENSEVVRKPIASDLGQGFSIYPVDANGHRVDWHDKMRKGVVHVREYDEVTPDPTSTMDAPKPPLKIEPRIAVMPAFCPGADRETIEAAVAAKISLSTVAATAKLEAVKEAPKEIEVGEIGAAELKP